DDTLKGRLVEAAQAALGGAPGVEGGIWQADAGSLAYAFPTYEGTGPKTDLPEAERTSIRQVNGDVARSERPLTMRQTTRSQVLLLHACPIAGPLPNVTAWTMTRVFTGQGPAYNQLLIGLTVLAVTGLGSAIWVRGVLFFVVGKNPAAGGAPWGPPHGLPAVAPSGGGGRAAPGRGP